MLSLQYQKDIRATYAPLDAETEKELVLKAQNGDIKARNDIVNSQLRQIINVAKAYSNQYTDMEELIGYGVIGIDHALTIFDVSKGNRFYTFAVNWIRAEIQKYTLNNYSVRIPMNIVKGATKALKKPEEERTAKEQGYIDQMTYFSQAMSMDTPIDEGERTTFGDMLSVDDGYHSEYLDDNQIANCMSCLDDNERKLVSMFYGLGSVEYKMPEIGEYFGVSKQTISVRLKTALNKMRKVNH
jgi:RNA polymerase primary sigma factor